MDEEKLTGIIKENEYLIYTIAKNYETYYNIEDLYQVGVIGIIKAYRKYNNNSDTKFSSYAYKYILGEIISFIKKDRNIQVSDETFSLYKKYLKVKDLLLNKNEIEPTLKEISSFMEIDEHKLVSIIESVAFTKNIDNSYEIVNDEREQIDNKIVLDNEIASLDEFEQNLINYRYYQGYNQNQTAMLMGLSQATVSREEKNILMKLKSNLN